MTAIFLRSFLILALAAGSATAQTALRPNPARFINEISNFGKQEPEKGGIVFTGSSSIRLWSSLKEDFPGLPVVNRGFGGAVSNDLIVYFETVVARHEPKLLVTYSGGNDLHEKLSVDEAFADYTKFLGMAHERFPQIHIILTSVKIAPRRADQIPKVHALNERLEAWCAGKSWMRFVDSTSYLADPQAAPDPAYFVDDNLHLNQAGYAKWKEILEPVVREEWEKVTGTSKIERSTSNVEMKN
jgi:lysophospholipase L1-like esterase